MKRLFISIKTNPTPRLGIGACIIATYARYADGHTLTRSLNYRKVDHINVANRFVADDEWSTESSQYRLEFLKYNDWEKLIQDELKFNPSPEWIQGIKNLQSKYPQFKQQSQLQLSLSCQGEV